MQLDIFGRIINLNIKITPHQYLNFGHNVNKCKFSKLIIKIHDDRQDLYM